MTRASRPGPSPPSGPLPGPARGSVVARLAIPLALALAAVLRFAWPLSDPPTRFSWSNGIYTDPPTMVHAARNAALWGTWIRDYNHDLWVYPLMNALTRIAYLPAGPGRLPGLVISALAGTLLVWTLARGLRRTAGPGAAVLGAFLAATCHWLAMFSRIPMAENVTVLLMAVAAVSALGRCARSLAIAGGLAAFAVFFGKFHAIGFLGGLTLFVLLRERSLRRAAPFLGAATAVVALWAAFIFLPHRAEITGHVARQSTGLHGALPFAVSLLDGIGEFYNTLRRSWMFYRMPVEGALGAFAALWLVGNAAARRTGLESGRAVWAFWFLGMWAYYGLLPYKAPRYFVLLAPPLVALAAETLAGWLRGDPVETRAPRRWDEHIPLALGLYSFFFGALDSVKHYASMSLEWLVLPPARISDGIYRGVIDVFRNIDTFLQNLAWAGILAVVTYVLVLWHPEILARFGRRPRIEGATMRRIAIGLLVASFGWASWQYGWWIAHRTTFLEDVKSSLPVMVREDAVLLGPLAPLLTQDSRHVCLPYFGPPGERGILETYGVTHIVVCGPGDAEQVEARFPGLLDRTTVVQIWPVHTLFSSTLEVRRLPSEVDGVPIHAYRPTLYEEASARAAAEDWEGALEAFGRYREAGEPPIPEVLSLESVCWYKLGNSARAEELLREAIRQRPKDPLNWQNLGILALRRGDRQAAMRHFVHALRLDPKNRDLEDMVRELAR